MADATIERINDRYGQLARQDDRSFVLQIETYLRALEDEPRGNP